jgi:ABC-type uncharacterized transport system fused permease/ATPase subunit
MVIKVKVFKVTQSKILVNLLLIYCVNETASSHHLTEKLERRNMEIRSIGDQFSENWCGINTNSVKLTIM